MFTLVTHGNPASIYIYTHIHICIYLQIFTYLTYTCKYCTHIHTGTHVCFRGGEFGQRCGYLHRVGCVLYESRIWTAVWVFTPCSLCVVGVENLDSGVGIYACDPEGYTVFADVLDAVIKDYHKVPDNKAIKHPACDFGNIEKLALEDLDPEGKFIISTRVRVGRSHKEYPFPQILTKEV
jgi:hypothetical protein